MAAALAFFFFLAQPFWETRAPDRWTAPEIEELLHDSPWARTVGPDPAVQVFLATAKPVEEAEAEIRRRMGTRRPDPDPDYTDYLRQNRDRVLVLAIRYPQVPGAGSASEERQLEKESIMIVGRRKYKIEGHFPPTPSDPVLRLVFPREFRLGDKRVVFRLYLPFLQFPEREVEFREKDLLYRGKLEI